MQITWFGLSSFKLVGKDLTIITDPFNNKTGLSPVRGAADVVILSNPKLDWSNNLSSIQGTPFVINGPGEYDIKGGHIMGAPAENKTLGPNAIYSIELDDIRIAFFGAFNQAELTDDQKETLEGADIVLIPVGGKDVCDYVKAADIATRLEPYYIVPHSYKIPGLNLNFDKPDNFIKEMGGKPVESDKITVKRKDFTTDTTSVIILAPQR